MDDESKLDEMDRRILRLLQADGRATYDQIAERVGLSASATLRTISASFSPDSTQHA